MLTGRPALVSVYLCFLCLNTLTHQSTDQVCVQDLLTRVRFVQQTAPQMLDCRLYTPTINVFQQKCPRTAMQCFADEIKVLFEEWNIIKEVGDLELNKALESLALKLDQTNSECPQCELFQEESVETFLKGLEKTLIYISNGPGVY